MEAVSSSPLCVDSLRKSFGDTEVVAGLSFELRRGECFGLLGPNGAGKTTTIEILEGLLPHDGGDVEVLGQRWGTSDRPLR
ncbi:MAG TPA: ATP-binding cassette domain-containing protein, partial [Rhodocyclaceae bacterium]|nr:ATP-binding cassette domain-containing protein [Rhodocyclaceae bacterium]